MARNRIVLTLVFAASFAGLLLYSFQMNAPKSKEHPAEHQEEGQDGVLRGTLGQVDSAKAKKVHVEIPNLDQAGADRIAQALKSLGKIGQVTADLGEQSFTIEYDSSGLAQNSVVGAVTGAGYQVRAAHAR